MNEPFLDDNMTIIFICLISTIQYLGCICFGSFHIIHFSRFMWSSFVFERNRIFWTPIKYAIFFKTITSQATSENVFQIIVVWCLREFQPPAISEIFNIYLITMSSPKYNFSNMYFSKIISLDTCLVYVSNSLG